MGKAISRQTATARLNDMQMAFVEQVVLHGHNQSQAAQIAGYEHAGEAGYRLMRNPKVINAIRELQDQYLVGEAKSVALTTLVDVMRNSKSDQAKVGACRVVESFLRAKDEKDGDDKPGKPIEEMSVGELESYMSTLSAAIEKRMSEQQIVDGEAHVID